MSMFKTVKLGPSGEVISDSGWTDDGSWSAESIISVVHPDGRIQEIRRKDFGKNTQSLADSDLQNLLGSIAQKSAVDTKNTEYQSTLDMLNAMSGGINEKQKAVEAQNAMDSAKAFGGSFTSPTGETTNINRQASAAGIGDSNISRGLKGRGLGNSTVGVGASQQLYSNLMGQLNQATTARASDVASERQKMMEQGALASGKTQKKYTYDPTKGWTMA